MARHTPPWRCSLIWAAITLLPQAAWSALAVTPPQLHPDTSGIVVTEVRSSLSAGSKWSVRLVHWQPGQAEPTPAVGEVSPRFFSLEAGGRQVIRARVKDRSAYHRLLVEQLPDQDSLGQGLAFRFRFSLPVYRQAQEPLAFTPNLPTGPGCHRFKNPEQLAVRLVLTRDLQGPQTLLPGETAELCRSTQTASQP
jgi:P pilus assembly chaperone PapD